MLADLKSHITCVGTQNQFKIWSVTFTLLFSSPRYPINLESFPPITWYLSLFEVITLPNEKYLWLIQVVCCGHNIFGSVVVIQVVWCAFTESLLRCYHITMSIEQIKEFLHQFKVVTDANFLGISLDNLIQLYVRQYGVHPNPTQLRSHICTALVNTFGSNCIGKFRDKKINKQNKKYCSIWSKFSSTRRKWLFLS